MAFTPDRVPLAPEKTAAAGFFDPAARDRATAAHHAATTRLAQAAIDAGYKVVAPNQRQDSAFITDDGVLVNIEVKTIHTGGHAGGDTGGDTASGGNGGGPSGAEQFRLGLGQVLEQRRRHQDTLDAGHGAELGFTTVVAVLAIEAPARVHASDGWQLWERTCADAAVVLSSVNDLEQRIRDRSARAPPDAHA